MKTIVIHKLNELYLLYLQIICITTIDPNVAKKLLCIGWRAKIRSNEVVQELYWKEWIYMECEHGANYLLLKYSFSKQEKLENVGLIIKIFRKDMIAAPALDTVVLNECGNEKEINSKPDAYSCR